MHVLSLSGGEIYILLYSFSLMSMYKKSQTNLKVLGYDGVQQYQLQGHGTPGKHVFKATGANG